MKYTRESTKYIFKNFFYLVPFAILPAIFFAISVDEAAIQAIMKKLVSKSTEGWNFFVLFRAISVLNFGTWQSIVSGIIGIIVTVPCVALLFALIEKHFRIGKRTFNGIWGKLNDNFVSTCGYVLLLLFIYEIWALLLSAILTLIFLIDLWVLAYVLAGVALLAMHFVLVQAIGAIYLWLPCMQITGFRALEALHYSQQLMTPIKKKLAVGQLLVLLVIEGLICVCAVFLPPAGIFLTITTILYVALILVYCVRMEIAYFDRDQIERADLNTYYKR